MTAPDLVERLREAKEAERRAVSDAAAVTAHADALEQALQTVGAFVGVSWEADSVPANLARVLEAMARIAHVQVDGPIPVGPSRKEAVRIAVEAERARCAAVCLDVARSFTEGEYSYRASGALECAEAIERRPVAS